MRRTQVWKKNSSSAKSSAGSDIEIWLDGHPDQPAAYDLVLPAHESTQRHHSTTINPTSRRKLGEISINVMESRRKGQQSPRRGRSANKAGPPPQSPDPDQTPRANHSHRSTVCYMFRVSAMSQDSKWIADLCIIIRISHCPLTPFSNPQ